MGMLGTAAYILAMDTFGPITDNAGGIVEMNHQPEDIRKKTDRLDAVGNTTKALTKGYAIGSAALAAFLLFSAYLDEVRNYGFKIETVDIAKPEIFVGGLLGAMLVFLFSALAIRAVSQAAQYVIMEVRRQFKEKPGILAGKERPDYGRCVDIVTRGALRQMVLPGILAVAMPIVTGVVFKAAFHAGAEAVAALLMVGTMAGILMATMLNNGGGAWDNAKKYIETGMYGGKGSDAHKAAVVGDTVGDPFKDTAGPSRHEPGLCLLPRQAPQMAVEHERGLVAAEAPSVGVRRGVRLGRPSTTSRCKHDAHSSLLMRPRLSPTARRTALRSPPPQRSPTCTPAS